MAKGKHGVGSAQQREREASEKVACLETQIQDLKDRLKAAERHADTFDNLRTELANTKAQLKANTTDQVEALRASVKRLHVERKDMKAQVKQQRKKNEKLFGRMVEHLKIEHRMSGEDAISLMVEWLDGHKGGMVLTSDEMSRAGRKADRSGDEKTKRRFSQWAHAMSDRKAEDVSQWTGDDEG